MEPTEKRLWIQPFPKNNYGNVKSGAIFTKKSIFFVIESSVNPEKNQNAHDAF